MHSVEAFEAYTHLSALLGGTGVGMSRVEKDEVIATLRAHAAELRAAGIVRLRLVAEFDRSLWLIDLVGLENKLADLLGHPVDLGQERTLKPRVRSNVDREAVLAF